MRIHVLAALAAFLAGPANSQSCTVVSISPDTWSGEVSGYVLDSQPLCYFYDRADGTGFAELISGNACFIPEGLADCTRSFNFTARGNGFRFFVHQDRLQAGHEHFTLRLTLY